MPLFSYQALNENGKKVSGVIDADSFFLAKDRLKKQQVLITQLSLLSKTAQEIVLPDALLLNFTRELSQLLKAGLPLYESLLTIEEKYRKNKCHALFLNLCDQLKNGTSLSTALSQYPKTFNEIYLSIVRAAEQSGSLSQSFIHLTALISKQQKLKKQLFASLAYPAFLGCFCFLVVCVLFFFVIPSMQELFEGRRLHPLTTVVLSVSLWLNHNAMLLAVLFLFAIGGLWMALRNKKVKIRLYQFFISLPFFNTLFVQSSLVRFCRAMFLLLSGGVPLIEALSFSRKTMNNPLLESVIEEAERRVIEGKKLSTLLSESPYIPSLMIRMLAIAEETGKMGPIMQNLSEIYEEELDKNLNQFTAFLQPAVLILLGAIVGIVVLSILLPLTDVSSFLSS